MNKSKQNRIIFCSAKKRNIEKILRTINNNQFKWAYFGENVSNAIAIEEKLKDRGIRLDIGDDLQKTADTLRQPYIDYIGNLSVENNSLFWWASSLSEKNPFISKTFLYSCYIKIVWSLIEYNHDTIVFFIECRELRLSLVKNLHSTLGQGVIHIEPKLSGFFNIFINMLEFIFKHAWFLLNNVYRIILVKHVYKLKNSCFIHKIESDDELILLHTWIDQRSFSNDNLFHDAYFGGLKDYINKKNKHLVIIPSILHTISYSKSIEKLLNCKEQFIIPSSFLNISNVLKILIMTLKRPKKKSYPYFNNMDISSLIYNDYINDWKNTRVASNLLFYYFIKNLRSCNLSVERFIYTYENHTWEKICCIAFREFFPKATIIGFQHGGLSKMLINYFFSEKERNIIPFPDIVITSGKCFRHILMMSGYDPNKILCGGAIRYKYLNNLSKQTVQQKKINRNSVNILVAPSIGKNEAAELVYKVVRSFGSMSMYNVILKFHPLMPYQQIANELNLKSLPEHFKVSLQPISKLLMDCDFLLYTESTTCIEAIAMGVYPINISSDIIIDCDFLDPIPEVRTKARTDDEIRCKVQELVEIDPKELNKRKAASMNAAEKIFSPVDDSVYEMFIKDK